MKIVQSTRCFAAASLLVLLMPIVLSTPQAYAESYVAGQFGVTFPQSLSNGTVTQDGFAGLDLSDQPLKTSAMRGAKLGHYLSKAPWMGVETGLSYTTPHVKEGSHLLWPWWPSSINCRASRLESSCSYLGYRCDLPVSWLSSPTIHRHRSLHLFCEVERT